jgi:hypothetical protein
MLWLFRKILDRLLVKSAVHVASELEAQIDLEVSETRATLLRKAHAFEQENIPGLEQVAASLRTRAARVAGESEVPAKDVVAIVALLRDENLRDELPASLSHHGDVADAPCAFLSALPAPEAKKRGRPRKSPADDAKPSDGELPAAS